MPALTAQQKKILIVASIAFGFLATLYVAMNRYYFQELQNLRTNNITDSLGNIYEGELKDGMLHGRGKITYWNGDVHEGEFKDSKLNGWGKISYKTGNVYEGEFKNDMLNGKCKITHSNGSVEESQFQR